MELTDYIVYIDTDSVYIRIGDFIKTHVNEDKWNILSEDQKIEYIAKASDVIEKYVNKNVFENTQLIDYNSNIENFKAVFKQETIASSALFVKKKKYAYLCKRDEGIKKDKVKVTGLEIVRSDTPEIIRPKLKKILEMILRGETDDIISNKINKYKKELRKCIPEEISGNIGGNNIHKYVDNKFQCKKGTPFHVRGIANYHFLLNKLKLKDRYENIAEGTKVKVVYVKPNIFGLTVISFYRWPVEFKNIIEVDYEKIIEKQFLKKIKMLLEPMKKEGLVENKNNAINEFF